MEIDTLYFQANIIYYRYRSLTAGFLPPTPFYISFPSVFETDTQDQEISLPHFFPLLVLSHDA